MARARKSDKSGSGKSKAFSIFDGDENHAEDGQEDLPKDEAGRDRQSDLGEKQGPPQPGDHEDDRIR